jgi:hypothetical protein
LYDEEKKKGGGGGDLNRIGVYRLNAQKRAMHVGKTLFANS